MKNLKYLFLAFALSLFIVPSSYALQCHQGNLGSDECWTNVQVSSSETNVVDRGTVLIYDFSSSANSDQAAYQVRVATATTDNYKVAGVAQNTIATGDSGLVLVRGQGKIKIAGAATSGDRLYTTGTGGRKGFTAVGTSLDATSAASRDKAIAFALETSTTDATKDAFIVVV